MNEETKRILSGIYELDRIKKASIKKIVLPTLFVIALLTGVTFSELPHKVIYTVQFASLVFVIVWGSYLKKEGHDKARGILKEYDIYDEYKEVKEKKNLQRGKYNTFKYMKQFKMILIFGSIGLVARVIYNIFYLNKSIEITLYIGGLTLIVIVLVFFELKREESSKAEKKEEVIQKYNLNKEDDMDV